MIRVKLASPILGAWSMAGVLGQPHEYYYYYYRSLSASYFCLYLLSFCKMVHWHSFELLSDIRWEWNQPSRSSVGYWSEKRRLGTGMGSTFQ